MFTFRFTRLLPTNPTSRHKWPFLTPIFCYFHVSPALRSFFSVFLSHSRDDYFRHLEDILEDTIFSAALLESTIGNFRRRLEDRCELKIQNFRFLTRARNTRHCTLNFVYTGVGSVIIPVEVVDDTIMTVLV